MEIAMKNSLKWGWLALSALVPAAAVAQPNHSSKYVVLTTYHVKPSANQDFADLLKNKWMPAMKKGGGSPRIFSSSPAGGDSNTYVISSYLDSFALFDGKTALSKGAGDAGAAALLAQRAQMIEGRTVVIMRRVPEMSVYPDSPRDSPLMLVQYNKLATGKREEFEALWKKDVAPAIRKAGRFVSVWRVVLGEELQFVTATPLESYADLDKGISASQMALEPAAYSAFNAKVGPLVASTRRQVLRLRKDLMGVE
jgi:hypothetical protein